MDKNKKVKNILLILVIIAFISVIIAGLIYVKETNNEIANLKKEVQSFKNKDNLINDVEEKEIYSNSELTNYITELSNAMLGYISYENDEIKFNGNFKVGKYFSPENNDVIVTIIENNKIQIQIDEMIYLGRYTVENKKLTMNVLLCISEADTLKCRKSVNNEDIVFNIIDNDKLKLESTNIDELNNLIGKTYER